MKNKVIAYCILPALRLFSTEKALGSKYTPEQYPNAARVEIFDEQGFAVVSIQTELGTQLCADVSGQPFSKFEEYATLVNNLPIMGAVGVDAPIYRLKTSVACGRVTIEMVDFEQSGQG